MTLVENELRIGDYLLIKLDQPLPFMPIRKCAIKGKEYTLDPIMGDKKSVYDINTIAIKETESLLGEEVTFF